MPPMVILLVKILTSVLALHILMLERVYIELLRFDSIDAIT